MNEQILHWLRRGHLTILLLVALGMVAALACNTGNEPNLEECTREAVATAIALGASVEDVERGDYDDLLREACYGL